MKRTLLISAATAFAAPALFAATPAHAVCNSWSGFTCTSGSPAFGTRSYAPRRTVTSSYRTQPPIRSYSPAPVRSVGYSHGSSRSVWQREQVDCPSGTTRQPDGTCLQQGRFGRSFGTSYGGSRISGSTISRSYGASPFIGSAYTTPSYSATVRSISTSHSSGYSSGFPGSFSGGFSGGVSGSVIGGDVLPCPPGTTPQPDRSCLVTGGNLRLPAQQVAPQFLHNTRYPSQGYSTAYGTPVTSQPLHYTQPTTFTPTPNYIQPQAASSWNLPHNQPAPAPPLPQVPGNGNGPTVVVYAIGMQ